MRLARRTFALPGALLCVLLGAASAQADPGITISSPADGAYVNDTTPTVAFTGATGLTTVTLNVNGVADTTVDFDTGSVTPGAAVTQTPRATVAFSVDDDGATVRSPVVLVHVDQVPDISGTGDGSVVDPADVDFDVSTAIPGNDVELRGAGADDIVGNGDDVLLATEQADGTGWAANMTPDVALVAGTHTVYAVTKDDHGDASSPSDAVTFDVAPAAPTYADLFTEAHLNQSAPAIAIVGADPSATRVTLYEVVEDQNGVGVLSSLGHTASVDVDGTATVIPSPGFTDGHHSLVITQTVNGVESLSNGVAAALVDIAVTTSAPVLSFSNEGTLLRTNRPYFDISGALANFLDNDTFVELYIDGQSAGHDGGDGGGAAGVQPDSAVSDGPHSAYVITVDDLGHRSVVHSNTLLFTVDTVGPAAPTVTSPANGSTTATSLPVVTVTTEPGAIAHVLVDDVGEESTATADADGNVTFTLTQALGDGVHELHVYSRDAAGNDGDMAATTFTVSTATAPPTPPAPPAPVTPVAPVAPTTPTANPVDPDGDGIANGWIIDGKAAPAPGAPKASVSGGRVKLKLAAAPKGAKSVRVYRADGKGDFKLVKTLTPTTKTFTDSKIKPGHSYKYKTVGVNAKGQQGKASGTATAKVKKK